MKDKYQIIFEQTANFARAEALSVTEAGLAGQRQAGRDRLRQRRHGARRHAKRARPAASATSRSIGFDALPEALVAVRDGTLAGTVEQFPGEQSRRRCASPSPTPRTREPKEKLVLLTPIVIGKDNLDKAERIGAK